MGKTAWSVNRGKIDRGYGHLPVQALDDWALHQSALSEKYAQNRSTGISATSEGRIRKKKMMDRINDALIQRSMLNLSALSCRLSEVEIRLEDPGLLENFEYFDVPSSDYMLQFYFAVWDRRIAEVMDYLHNYGKDLKGNPHWVPKSDIWYQMSYFEGMNNDKRKQARDVVEFMRTHHVTQATTFGGGNVPERLYGLPENLQLTVFDNGLVCPLDQLFMDPNDRSRVNYLHEPLSIAPGHPELLGTQDLVWMHGVSMYLKEEKGEMAGAILCGASLLKPGGYMRYDYLVWNYSMRRVVLTQCWPNDPRHPMTIFDDASAAICQGQQTINVVNAQLGGSAYMDVVDIGVNYFDPWGVTSVCFIVQKHA